MLFQINNLRVVVETAKRLLIKEQMDKKAEQSIASLSCKLAKTKTEWIKGYHLMQ